MKYYHLAAIGALGLGSIAVAHSALATPSADDFAQKVAVSNEFEIESSKLALEKSQDKDIKTFAQQMIDDHTQAGEDFKAALQKTQVSPPPEQLDSKHQKLMSKLQAANGDTFNKMYIDDQLKAHKKAVSLFSDYAKSGDNPQLKTFASQTLPTLKDHLSNIKELKSNE